MFYPRQSKRLIAIGFIVAFLGVAAYWAPRFLGGDFADLADGSRLAAMVTITLGGGIVILGFVTAKLAELETRIARIEGAGSGAVSSSTTPSASS